MYVHIYIDIIIMYIYIIVIYMYSDIHTQYSDILAFCLAFWHVFGSRHGPDPHLAEKSPY